MNFFHKSLNKSNLIILNNLLENGVKLQSQLRYQPSCRLKASSLQIKYLQNLNRLFCCMMQTCHVSHDKLKDRIKLIIIRVIKEESFYKWKTLKASNASVWSESIPNYTFIFYFFIARITKCFFSCAKRSKRLKSRWIRIKGLRYTFWLINCFNRHLYTTVYDELSINTVI